MSDLAEVQGIMILCCEANLGWRPTPHCIPCSLLKRSHMIPWLKPRNVRLISNFTHKSLAFIVEKPSHAYLAHVDLFHLKDKKSAVNEPTVEDE
jgi:hypothetical protein